MIDWYLLTYLPHLVPTYLFVSCLLFPWPVFTNFGWIWTLLDGRPDELLFLFISAFPCISYFYLLQYNQHYSVLPGRWAPVLLYVLHRWHGVRSRCTVLLNMAVMYSMYFCVYRSINPFTGGSRYTDNHYRAMPVFVQFRYTARKLPLHCPRHKIGFTLWFFFPFLCIPNHGICTVPCSCSRDSFTSHHC